MMQRDLQKCKSFSIEKIINSYFYKIIMKEYNLKIQIERYSSEGHSTYQPTMVGEIPKSLTLAMAELRDNVLKIAREKREAITLDIKVQSEL